jgi:hypothetical protein
MSSLVILCVTTISTTILTKYLMTSFWLNNNFNHGFNQTQISSLLATTKSDFSKISFLKPQT